MRKVPKEIFFSLCVHFGVTEYFKWRNRNKIIILMYHGVVEANLEPFCWMQITEQKIANQLKYLQHSYSILKLSEVVHRLLNGLPLPDYTAVVTFDDGYRNNYTVAYPILRRYQIKATIFLTTGCISKRAMCWHDLLYLGLKHTREKSLDLTQYGLRCYVLQGARDKEIAEREIVEYLKTKPCDKKDVVLNEILRSLIVGGNRGDGTFDLLTWEEVRTMRAEGLIEFGAHSATHNILSQMNDKRMKNEIIGSCGMIEDQLGSKCRLFAYPNGRKKDFNSKVKDILRNKGIICAVSTIPGLNDRDEDMLELRRVAVGADISDARFRCLVSGLLFSFKGLGKVFRSKFYGGPRFIQPDRVQH